MNLRRTIAWLVGALVFASPMPALAETWTFAVGSYQYVLTVGKTASQSFANHGQLVASDGSTSSMIVVGGRKSFTTMAQVKDPADPTKTTSQQCLYRTKSISEASATGTGSCSGVSFTWTAAISGSPRDDNKPTLLVGDADPRQSPAYSALDGPARDAVEKEAALYVRDMTILSAYIVLHDPACLGRQFLNIRLQKPGWSVQDVQQYIALTCIVPSQVSHHAEERCQALFGGGLVYKLSDPAAFCGCYAEKYTDAYVAAPANSTQYESNLGVDAARECYKSGVGIAASDQGAAGSN